MRRQLAIVLLCSVVRRQLFLFKLARKVRLPRALRTPSERTPFQLYGPLCDLQSEFVHLSLPSASASHDRTMAIITEQKTIRGPQIVELRLNGNALK